MAYLLIIALWAIIIVRRPGPTLWKGSSLVVLNLLFVMMLAASGVWRGRTASNGAGDTYWCCLSPGLLLLSLVLVVVAVVLRNTWILLRISQADSIAVLERCFTQTRSSAKQTDDGYVVQLGEQEMRVTIAPSAIGMPGLRVRFTGGGNSKKAALIRSLFTKQFYASVPTPRFRA